jgi:hypothetical protein
MGAGAPGVVPASKVTPPTPEPVQPKRAPAHYLWAVLIARIYEVFPLRCPMCGGPMRIIAFITHSADTRHILEHIGVQSQPPHIAPARGPPLVHLIGPCWLCDQFPICSIWVPSPACAPQSSHRASIGE